MLEFIDRNSFIFGKHKDADGHYPRIINLHLAFPELLKLYTENTIALAVQDSFFGSESSIYTTLYYERGSAQPIHRDTPYFCTRPEQKFLGVWTALEDANSKNGCLEVIRKGHLIPEFDRAEIALEHYNSVDDIPSNSQLLWDSYQEKLIRETKCLGLKVEKVELKAGETIIWHPQLPHGGSMIEDISLSRHSLVMHVTPVGIPVYHQDVFFNPEKFVSNQSSWGYIDYRNRKYAHHASIEFGHEDPHSPSDFL
jgi:ectoine hydroxylase-related dioxygenase (phytanoyl-CoA dioxygenase family)